MVCFATRIIFSFKVVKTKPQCICVVILKHAVHEQWTYTLKFGPGLLSKSHFCISHRIGGNRKRQYYRRTSIKNTYNQSFRLPFVARTYSSDFYHVRRLLRAFSIATYLVCIYQKQVQCQNRFVKYKWRQVGFAREFPNRLNGYTLPENNPSL